jgi:hypothetical protein
VVVEQLALKPNRVVLVKQTDVFTQAGVTTVKAAVDFFLTVIGEKLEILVAQALVTFNVAV